MKYINDLSPPVIVLAGTLNPAILNPVWVARNIFEYEDGSVLNIHHAFYQLEDELRQLTVLDGVGWSVTTKRCEIFITSFDEDVVGRAERFACSVVKTLPHTPWSSAGVNFQFISDDDIDELMERYNTAEGFEDKYSVESQSISSAIRISPLLTMNVQRNISQKFSILFNHHHHALTPEGVDGILVGSISSSLDRCRGMMNEYFSMTDEEMQFLAPNEGELADVG